MNTDSVVRMEEEPAQPLVDWYPPAGPLRALSLPVAAGLGALAFGALAYAGYALARRLHEKLDP
ncbi:MAG: hypothetical protein M3M95_03230 [Pseudomonadota bacterium]|nr:hypothetical protein [Pseudomonadota bacterium]